MNASDPDRFKKLRVGEPGEIMVSPRIALGALIVAVIAGVAFFFWPAEENVRNTTTDHSTLVERTPAKPSSARATPSSPNQ
jgi:hypothetical protein